jgi:transmembrane sensor
MQEKEIAVILQNYKNGIASEAEIALLERWYLTYQEPEVHELDLESRAKDLDRVLSNIKQLQQGKSVKKRMWPIRFSAAAVLFLLLAAGIFFYSKYEKTKANQLAQQSIVPGGNKATLTLANGKVINLTEAQNGDLSKQAGIQISKTADGQLIYTIEDASAADDSKLIYNTISTPKGGQYQLKLPDGSKIWLNAASSLKYPANLTSLNERRVELSGEAYFEIAKDHSKPFIVATNKQEVKVLGTHFNVKDYADDHSTKTTLLEGSVQVTAEVNPQPILLKPGQQSNLIAGTIKVSEVEAEDEIDWKNGDFVFKAENLKSIMRKIARWYNVEVEYQDNVPQDVELEGLVSRSRSITEVLKLMESTDKVHFKFEGRKIIVTK